MSVIYIVLNCNITKVLNDFCDVYSFSKRYKINISAYFAKTKRWRFRGMSYTFQFTFHEFKLSVMIYFDRVRCEV